MLRHILQVMIVLLEIFSWQPFHLVCITGFHYSFDKLTVTMASLDGKCLRVHIVPSSGAVVFHSKCSKKKGGEGFVKIELLLRCCMPLELNFKHSTVGKDMLVFRLSNYPLLRFLSNFDSDSLG